MRTKSNGRKRTQRLRSLGPLLFFACNREEGKTNCLRLPRSCRRTSCRMAARKPWSVAVAISRTRHRFLKGTGPRPPHALLRRSQLLARKKSMCRFSSLKSPHIGFLWTPIVQFSRIKRNSFQKSEAVFTWHNALELDILFAHWLCANSFCPICILCK